MVYYLWYDFLPNSHQGGTGMKSCDWCLWLGNEKIFNIRQLRENFDTAVLVGYYLGGGLERWLSDAEETAVLEKVQNIDRGGDIGSQLEFIFGVRPDPKPETAAVPEYKAVEQAKEYHEVAESVKLALMAVSGDYSSFASSFGSFRPTSYRYAFEHEFEKSSFRSGSFRVGSFNIGSFRSRMLRAGGSFRTGSFRLVKFGYNQGSFRTGSGFSGSFTGSFRPTSGGSFRFYMGNAEITREEYKRTKINLSSCPLNAYGYGIHKI